MRRKKKRKTQRPAIVVKVAFLDVMCFVNANYPNNVCIFWFLATVYTM